MLNKGRMLLRKAMARVKITENKWFLDKIYKNYEPDKDVINVFDILGHRCLWNIQEKPATINDVFV